MPNPSAPMVPMNFFAEEPAENGVHLLEYWHIIWRHKWGIAGIILICTLVGVMQTIKAIPVYRATATLLAEPVTSRGDELWNAYAMLSTFYQTQQDLIKSRAVASRVVDQLGLLIKEEEKRAKSSEIDEKIKEPVFFEQLFGFELNWRQWIPAEWLGPPPRQATLEEVRQGLISRIASGVRVRTGESSQFIYISYHSADPKFAADVTNAVATAYMEFGLESRLNSAQQTSAWLGNQLMEMRQRLDASEKALQEYQKTTGMVDTGSRHQMLGSQLTGLSEQQIKAQATRHEAERRYHQAMRLQRQGEDSDVILSSLGNSLVSQLRNSQIQLQRRVKELSERYGEKHPKMLAARSDLAETTRALNTEIARVTSSLRKEYELAVERERKANQLVNTKKREISEVGDEVLTLAELEREVENNRQLYETLLVRFQKQDVAEQYDISNIRIIDRALIPATPYAPNKQKMLLMAIGIGLILGIGFAVAREKLNNTFKKTEDLENLLKIPVLGVIPLLRKLKKTELPELQVQKKPEHSFSEAVNHIVTGILFSNIDQPPRTLLVTSATAGEGKTTLSTNLALAFSRRDRTLLLEADLRKPRLGKIFGGKKRELGLTDLISGQASLRDCMVQDEQNPNLFVLSAGTKPPNPLEFLSSESFRHGLAQLQEKFTHIVIDAPPLLPVSDAVVLSRLADGTVLLVRSESTTKKLAQDGLRRLNAAHSHLIGSVLGQIDARRMHYYASRYYYYYDSGYYGGYAEIEH